MACLSHVRIAVEADKQELWRLFLQAFKENAMFSLSPEKVGWWLDRMLHPEIIPAWDTGPRGAIGVIGSVGQLEGLVFVTFGQYWYTNDRHLEEFIVYVDPECRRSEHAKALVEWMKEQSNLTGLPLVTGIMSNHRTEAKVRLYERFLPKVGAFFLYNGKGSVQSSSAVAIGG